MTVTSWEIKKIGELFATTLLAMVIISASDSVPVQIIAFVFASLVPVAIVKFDIFHPYCWFSAFFCVYSVSYSLLHCMGYSIYGYNKIILQYELIALLVTLIIISPRKYKYDYDSIKQKLNVNTGIFNRILYIVMALALIIGAFYIRQTGYVNKRQIYANSGLLMNLVFRIPLVFSILTPFIMVDEYNKKGKIPVRYILVVAFSIAIITFFSGERDFLFRYMLILIFLLFFFGIIKNRHFLILIPAFIVLFPLSAIYKYYFLGGGIAAKVNNGFLYAFLTSDFNSASQNLQYLVSNGDADGMLGFSRLGKDVNSLFSNSVPSMTSWYNNTFFANSRSGKGFSLVGEGYVIGGVVGIIVVFAIVGLIIKFFYANSQKNIWFFSAYLYFITLMIYSIRGDLSTIYSGILRQIIPVELLIFMLMYFCRQKPKRYFQGERI